MLHERWLQSSNMSKVQHTYWDPAIQHVVGNSQEPKTALSSQSAHLPGPGHPAHIPMLQRAYLYIHSSTSDCLEVCVKPILAVIAMKLLP